MFLRDNNPAASGWTGTDEGRGMMELVHDIAPGSPKAFSTCGDFDGAYAQNIRDLAQPVASGGAGAKVIVDDVGFGDEPFYQDGTVAQAVNDVVANSGVAYFSSAGNELDQSYENTSPSFATDTISGISGSSQSYLKWDTSGVSSSDRMMITLASGDSIDFALQWDQPFYTTNGVTTNLDMYFLNHTTGAVLYSATTNNIALQTPYEELGIANQGTSSLQIDLVVRNTSGPAPGGSSSSTTARRSPGSTRPIARRSSATRRRPTPGLTHQVSRGFGPVLSRDSRSSIPQSGAEWQYSCLCWSSPP